MKPEELIKILWDEVYYHSPTPRVFEQDNLNLFNVPTITVPVERLKKFRASYVILQEFAAIVCGVEDAKELTSDYLRKYLEATCEKQST